jgi:hypothetical protein
VFLDDQVALLSLDDGLTVEVFVPRRDKEPERVLSHLLEGGGIDLDRDRAARVRALIVSSSTTSCS